MAKAKLIDFPYYSVYGTMPFAPTIVRENEDGSGSGVPGAGGDGAGGGEGAGGEGTNQDKDFAAFAANPWHTAQADGQGKPDANGGTQQRTATQENGQQPNANELIDNVFNSYRVFEGADFAAANEAASNGDYKPMQQMFEGALKNQMVGMLNTMTQMMNKQGEAWRRDVLSQAGESYRFANTVEKLGTEYPELMNDPFTKPMMTAALKQANIQFKNDPQKVGRAMQAIADRLKGGIGKPKNDGGQPSSQDAFNQMAASILGDVADDE